ncbi:MAG: alpha/beta hydrolase family protein, partial [Pseudonocardiaceae bacterium]
AALVLGINQTLPGAPCSGITVNLGHGSWKHIWSVSDTSNDQILLYSPHAKLIIVSSTVSGRHRLGWAHVGDPTVHFPETLHRPGYLRQALALDDHGERLLVHEVTGAISRLLIHTPTTDRLELLPSPPGRVSAPASWVGDLIRFRFSTPRHIPTLATVRLGPEPEWSVSGGPELDIRPGGPSAELITLEGRAGPIEAIVYGGPGWRECAHLVVALHGGPLSAWRFEFNPLLHCLSTHGIAVVAPNYRGSTGYGEEHLRAVIGAWGGPDLDDVLDLGRSLRQDRAPRRLAEPIVLGVSYGAFLALLAVCLEPPLWSGCVALAPFLSGTYFHDNANVAVQHRIDQLGGRRQLDDALGPRDVLRACTTLSTPLLLMHGTQDDTIPVQQSRTLRQRLLELGKTENIDFDYLEVDTDHAGLVRAQSRDVNQRVIRFCLARSRTASHCDGKWSKSITHRRRYDHGKL